MIIRIIDFVITITDHFSFAKRYSITETLEHKVD